MTSAGRSPATGSDAVGTTATALAGLLERHRFLLTVGAGGVGKTTASAALATAAALTLPARVLVLTIDPAKRLADALGIEIGDAAEVVPASAFDQLGMRPRGELSVSMLDTETGWAELIARHAPDTDVRDAILRNRLFQNLTGRFVQSHGYLAMERLWDVADEYDLVVVDTPPSRNTLDILDAPTQMTEFFGSGLLRWLIAPYRSRLFSAASRPFYMVADRVLGDRFLSDITDFFILFQQLAPAFNAHAAEVEQLLRTEAGFVVVSTLERSPVEEAVFLIGEIERRGLRLAGTIANRTLARTLTEPATVEAVAALAPERVAGIVAGLDSASFDPETVAATLDRLHAEAPTLLEMAGREAIQRERLATAGGVEPIDLGLRGRGIDDLAGVGALIGVDDASVDDASVGNDSVGNDSVEAVGPASPKAGRQ